jgi:hypothetical protein
VPTAGERQEPPRHQHNCPVSVEPWPASGGEAVASGPKPHTPSNDPPISANGFGRVLDLVNLSLPSAASPRARNLPRMFPEVRQLTRPAVLTTNNGYSRLTGGCLGREALPGGQAWMPPAPAVSVTAPAKAGMPAGAVSVSPATWVSPRPRLSLRGRRPCRCGVPVGSPPCLGMVPP